LVSVIKKEHELKVFENRVLRRKFEPKSHETIGGLSKLHNEELHNLYSSPNTCSSRDQVKEDEMGRTCSTHVRKVNAYKMLVGKPEGKKLKRR
jgi:hypothetical protein